jgi:nucleoid DNA-binding protein
MEELTKLVAEKTGLSDEMSKVAVDTVIDFLKDKLPGPAGAQLDALLEGGDVSSLLGGLGSILGGK